MEESASPMSTDTTTLIIRAHTAFHAFNNFVDEIMLRIWEFALPGPRLIEIRATRYAEENSTDVTLKCRAYEPVPSLLHACIMSRQVALKKYALCFQNELVRPVYFDMKSDGIIVGGSGLDADVFVRGNVDRLGLWDVPLLVLDHYYHLLARSERDRWDLNYDEEQVLWEAKIKAREEENKGMGRHVGFKKFVLLGSGEGFIDLDELEDHLDIEALDPENFRPDDPAQFSLSDQYYDLKEALDDEGEKWPQTQETAKEAGVELPVWRRPEVIQMTPMELLKEYTFRGRRSHHVKQHRRVLRASFKIGDIWHEEDYDARYERCDHGSITCEILGAYKDQDVTLVRTEYVWVED